MADFEQAVKIVLKNEGKYSNDPHDLGRATAYGISLRFLLLSGIDINKDNAVDIQDILCLNPFEAKKIYKEFWWDKYKFGDIDNQAIATKLFDLSVNAGPSEIIKIAQRAINSFVDHSIAQAYLTVDGVLGQRTIHSINYLCKIKKQDALLEKIKDNAVSFYNKIVILNPKLAKFEKGWNNRAKN